METETTQQKRERLEKEVKELTKNLEEFLLDSVHLYKMDEDEVEIRDMFLYAEYDKEFKSFLRKLRLLYKAIEGE